MIKKITFLILIVSTSFTKMLATDYYVDAINGNDSNNGTSSTSAFRSLWKIDQQNLAPGDNVFFMNGTYTRPGQTLLTISESGNADNWITLQNYEGHEPLLEFDSWTGIDLINGASYIKMKGLRVKGARTKINLEQALAQPGSCANPDGGPNGFYNGTGILAVGPNLTWSNPATRGNEVPHHITIEDCEVFDCTSSGIALQQADYVTVKNNEIYNNAWYTIYGTSGLQLYQFINTDGTTGFHNEISNNLMYGNQLLVPQVPSCRFYDGNAMIVDDFRHIQTGNYRDQSITYPSYTAKTLVTNNIAVENGGSGFHFFLSTNCYIYNNTSVNNAFQNGGINGNGELRVGACRDFEVKNNIFKGARVHRVNNNSNFDYAYNYQSGGLINEEITESCEGCTDGELNFLNENIADATPFITSDEGILKNAGVVVYNVPTDYRGNTRFGDDLLYDIGAYELGPCTNTIWYADVDGDGVGVVEDSIESCTQPEGYVATSGDLCPNDGDTLEITTWYADLDGDGVGVVEDSIESCARPEGYVATSGDLCPNDGDALNAKTWYADVDGDGVGVVEDSIESCTQPEGYVATSGDLCPNDGDALNAKTWYADDDGDGVGSTNDSIESCTQPEGYVATSGDLCPNDSSKSNPGECGCEVEEGTCDTSDTICSSPNWVSNFTYSSPGNTVLYEGIVYENKWYTRGSVPRSGGGPWEAVAVCESTIECSSLSEWNSQSVYAQSRTEVIFNNLVYRNRWYTRGQSPDSNNVWDLIGGCAPTAVALRANFPFKTEELYVYPTEVIDVVEVVNSDKIEVQLYGLSGREIDSWSLESGNNTLNLSEVAPGFYILKIKGENREERIKLLKK